MGRKREDVKYLSIEQALGVVRCTSNTDSGISAELLTLRRVYAITPSYIGDGAVLNHEGLLEIQRAAAIVASSAIKQLMSVNGVTYAEAIAAINDARDYQTKAWPSLIEPDRSLEEWILLTFEYQDRLYAISGEHPFPSNARIQKYAAIVANLALWAVQAAKGEPLTL